MMVSSWPALSRVRSIPSDKDTTSERTAAPIERTRSSATASGSLIARAALAKASALALISCERRMRDTKPQTMRTGNKTNANRAIKPGSLAMSPSPSRFAISSEKLRLATAKPMVSQSTVKMPASQRGHADAPRTGGRFRLAAGAGDVRTGVPRSPAPGVRLAPSFCASIDADKPLVSPGRRSCRTSSSVAWFSCASRSSNSASSVLLRGSTLNASSTALRVSSEIRLAEGLETMCWTFGQLWTNCEPGRAVPGQTPGEHVCLAGTTLEGD